MVVEKVHPSEEIMYMVLLWRPLLQLYKWVLYFLCFWIQAANVLNGRTFHDLTQPAFLVVLYLARKLWGQDLQWLRPHNMQLQPQNLHLFLLHKKWKAQKISLIFWVWNLTATQLQTTMNGLHSNVSVYSLYPVLITHCLNSASLDGVQAENLHALQQGHLSIGSLRFGIFDSRFKNLSNIYSFWEIMFSSHTHWTPRSTHKLIASKRCSCHLLFGVF